MRLATRTLALLGFLLIGATLATAGHGAVNAATVEMLAPATDEGIVTPVDWYYVPDTPGQANGNWPYYTYRPYFDFSYRVPRGYDAYYGQGPYSSYSGYPYYQDPGPRRAFNFAR